MWDKKHKAAFFPVAGQASSFTRRVQALIARIPAGTVATYGQLAELAGYPRRARRVGQLLSHLPPGTDLPWHRVINAQGRISPRSGAGRQNRTRQQECLLKSEGVQLRGGRIPLEHYRWQPIIDENWP